MENELRATRDGPREGRARRRRRPRRRRPAPGGDRVKLSALRRRWPEAALIAALAIVAVFTGLAWRSVAIVLIGGVAIFALRRRVGDLVRGALITSCVLLVTLARHVHHRPRVRLRRRDQGLRRTPRGRSSSSARCISAGSASRSRAVASSSRTCGSKGSRRATRRSSPRRRINDRLPLVAGVQHPRVLHPVGRDDRLDDADREVRRRQQHAQPEAEDEDAARAEALHDDALLPARLPGAVHLHRPLHVDDRGAQPRHLRAARHRRVPRDRDDHRRHGPDQGLPADAGRHAREVQDRRQPAAASRDRACTPTARTRW